VSASCNAATPEAPDLPVGARRLLLRYLRRHLGMSMNLMATIAAGSVCAVAAQYGLKLLVDAMTATSVDRRHVLFCLSLFLGLLGMESVCWRLGGVLGSRTIIRVSEDIRIDLFEAVSKRSWQFFNGQASGALAGRITAAAASATAVMRTVVWSVLPPVIDLLGSVVVLATIDWRIGVALIFVAGVSTFVLHWIGQRGFPLHHSYHSTAADVSGSLADVLANMGLVRSYGARIRERDSLRLMIEQEGIAHSASWMFLERLRCAHDVTFWLANASVLTAAVLQWSRGEISTGSVVVATTLSLRILAGSREMALSLLGLSQQVAAVTEAVDVLKPPLKERVSNSLPTLQASAGAIELQKVRYAPEEGRTLFDPVDLAIPAGQRVGVVGGSGAGKSTLLRLIQGVTPPAHGAVLLNRQKLTDYAPESLANAFCVVSQEVTLLHRSLAENLSYGRPDAPWEDVLRVSHAVGCDDFVDKLPEGYRTIVGERGVRMSGGQRQRIAVARALLRRAPVLLLDEATSALDSNAELQVQRAILALAGHCTIVAVAHRLSTVMDFDRIVVLENGRIVEDGAPCELREADGPFAGMWRLQNRDYTKFGHARANNPTNREAIQI
jgi:ATP-binding cassette subfamily B protein